MHEETLAAILDAADEAIICFDRDGRCRFAGRRLGELFGVDVASLVGGRERDVVALLASSCEEPETFHELTSGAAGPAQQTGELELRRPTVRVVRWHTTPILSSTGPTGWAGIARDVTRERSAERRANQLLQRLEMITATDALTQLPNKRRFLEEIEREHGRAARAWDSYAVLRMDVDKMRRLNEELGRPRGDEVLEAVAARLREGRREYDVLARLESDEFVLLLPGADAHAAYIVAQRITAAVSKHPVELDVPRRVSIAVGAAVWTPPSGETAAEVVTRAGLALGRARSRGTGQLEIDVLLEADRPKSQPPARRDAGPR